MFSLLGLAARHGIIFRNLTHGQEGHGGFSDFPTARPHMFVDQAPPQEILLVLSVGINQTNARKTDSDGLFASIHRPLFNLDKYYNVVTKWFEFALQMKT